MLAYWNHLNKRTRPRVEVESFGPGRSKIFEAVEVDDSGFVMLHPGLPEEKIRLSSPLARVAIRIYCEMVKFNHRSIVEFLQTKGASVRLKEATVGFDFFNAWQHGVSSQLRSINISPTLRRQWYFPRMPSLPRMPPLFWSDVSFHLEFSIMIRWAIDNPRKADTRQMYVFLDRVVSATEATGFLKPT